VASSNFRSLGNTLDCCLTK